jgi:multicomponent Na+:H+ antiporter subunit D
MNSDAMGINFIIAPILLPLISAVLLMFFWSKPNIQRRLSILMHLLQVVAATWLFFKVYKGDILISQAGNWAAPYGITFVADAFSGLMILLTALSGMAVGLFSSASIKSARAQFGFFPLIQFLLMGLNGSFLAGDIFNLYVWFEVIIISSFVLITLGGEKAQLEGAIKYVTLNLLASVIFLTAIAILYGILGSLNLADLAMKVRDNSQTGLVSSAAILFLLAFGIKSAIFPLYFWLPASYHTPPAAISALFGGLLTKVGVYALIRIFSLLFIQDLFIQNLLMWMAILTMISGALGAIVSVNLRKIFSYLIISHIGFMVGGFSMFSTMAVAGAVLYMTHDIIAKTNIFLISGLIFKIKGSFRLERLSGLFNEMPYLSLLFAFGMFALVGTPPLSGFWPKLMMLQGAFPSGAWWLIGSIILASFLTLWAVVRVWNVVFWQKAPGAPAPGKVPNVLQLAKGANRWALLGSVILLTAVSLFIGFGVKPVAELCLLIAGQLIDPQVYIETVLNLNPTR